MNEPIEPSCPPDRKPHGDRVKDISEMLSEGKIGLIAIEDTPEHRAWYLHEIKKYPTLVVVTQDVLVPGIYSIQVRKVPSPN